MEWQEYVSASAEFDASLVRGRFLSAASAHSFRDFPQAFPTSVRAGIVAAQAAIREELTEIMDAIGLPSVALAETARNNVVPIRAGVAHAAEPIQDPLLREAAIDLYMYIFRRRLDPADLGFEELVRKHELVMVVAHLDAFLVDTLRAACTRRPDLLRTGKQIEWKDVVATGSGDALLAHLTDLLVRDFNVGPFSKRVRGLGKLLNSAIKASREDLGRIDYAAQVRHVIVHTGGRATPAFIRDTKADLAPGQLIPVNDLLLRDLAESARRIGQRVFFSVVPVVFNENPHAANPTGVLFEEVDGPLESA